MRTIAALGGHLLARDALDEVRTAVALLGGDLVVTHGNGPQVGEDLDRRPESPLHAAVARTQGELGSQLASALGGVCVVTHVVVSRDDPAFSKPTKPIGPWLAERPAGSAVHDEAQGWRRVVASPEPLEVVELEAIRTLVDAGTTVVCCGGGGIPIADGSVVDAVVDKDRVSALVAAELGARRLVVLTDVDAVYAGYRTAGGRRVPQLSVEQAAAMVRELPPGSMGPKLEACSAFVRATGGEALVTSASALEGALAGRAGTRIAG